VADGGEHGHAHAGLGMIEAASSAVMPGIPFSRASAGSDRSVAGAGALLAEEDVHPGDRASRKAIWSGSSPASSA
jgi:hypothetical protein